jgi:hypothetical protein
MDGSVDLRLIITVAGLIFSVVAASAVARYQIKELIEQVHELRKLVGAIDLRVDRSELTIQSVQQRTDMLAHMSSPEVLERRHREIAALIKDVEILKAKP